MADEHGGLYAEYQRVMKSLLGSEMVLQCGSEVLKVTSGRLRGARLFWKSGIEWVELPDAEFGEMGVMFEGLSVKGGVPIQQLVSQVDLPIHNRPFIEVQDPRIRYLRKLRSETYIPFRYEIDFVSRTMTSYNMAPITDHVVLRSEEYGKAERQLGAFPLTSTARADREQMQTKRDQQIRSVVEQFRDPVEIVTPEKEYRRSHACLVIN